MDKDANEQAQNDRHKSVGKDANVSVGLSRSQSMKYEAISLILFYK